LMRDQVFVPLMDLMCLIFNLVLHISKKIGAVLNCRGQRCLY